MEYERLQQITTDARRGGVGAALSLFLNGPSYVRELLEHLSETIMRVEREKEILRHDAVTLEGRKSVEVEAAAKEGWRQAVVSPADTKLDLELVREVVKKAQPVEVTGEARLHPNPPPGVRVILRSLAFVVGLAGLASCSDATGPSALPELGPQFRMAYQGGEGGGHGGGGGGGAAACTKPNASLECFLKYGALGVGGGVLVACNVACAIGGAPAWAWGAYDYNNTPDCRTCGYENAGVGTGRGIGATNDRNLPPGSPPDTGGW